MCQLFDDGFDASQCSAQVCKDCRRLKKEAISKEIKMYCKSMLRSSCKTLPFAQTAARPVDDPDSGGERSGAWDVVRTRDVRWKGVEKKNGRCFRTIKKRVTVPCNRKMPSGEMCENGCRVRKCRAASTTYDKACMAKIPPKCRSATRRKPKCYMKPVKKAECKFVRKRKLCLREETKQMPCQRYKSVTAPCKSKGIHKLFGKALSMIQRKCQGMVKRSYRCGNKLLKMKTLCPYKSYCSTKYCDVKVCK